MRRSFGIFIAAATLCVSLAPEAFAQEAGQQQPAAPAGQQGGQQQPPAPAGQQQQPAATTGQQEQEQQALQKVTFDGDVVLWAFTVHPDKTADYEQVLAKLKESIVKLGRPELQQQAAGWKIIKNATPQGDGSILYIHVIDPVVPGADYSITNIVYEAFPDPQERIDFYELYRGAIKAAFFTIQAPVVADMSK